MHTQACIIFSVRKDQLSKEWKEQEVLESVAQKGIKIYTPTTMNLIPFSLGGWSIRVELAAAQLLRKTDGQGSRETG